MSAPPPDALQRTTLLPDPHTHHELHQQQTRQLKQQEGAVTAPASRNGMAATGGGGEDGQKGSSVHYVFSAECDNYFDWQSIALFYSYRRVYGETDAARGITRLLACSRENELSSYPSERLDLVPTHVHRNFENFGGDDDVYVAYNKPGAMFSFTNYHMMHDGGADQSSSDGKTPPSGTLHEDPEYPQWRPDAPRIEVKRGGARESMLDDEYLVYLDADMILLDKVDAQSLLQNEAPRTTIAGFYGYLKGVENGMAKDFGLTEGQQALMSKVGGWMIAKRADMAIVAPHWLEMTKTVRNCESVSCGSTDDSRFAVWSKTGDEYITREMPKPWISEMYGYVFGSAVAGQRHVTNDKIMAYPGYAIEFDPKIIHYGLSVFICVRRKSGARGWSALDLEYQAKVGACPQDMRELYKFDKHWVDSDQVMRCEASVDKSTGAQLTPFAPVPSWESVNGSVVGGPYEERAMEYLIALMETLNEAVLEYKRQKCPAKVERSAVACVDKLNMCEDWAETGQCKDEVLEPFMKFSCPLSCKVCELRVVGSQDGQRARENNAPSRTSTVNAKSVDESASVHDPQKDDDAAQYQMQISGGSTQASDSSSALLEEHLLHREKELDKKLKKEASKTHDMDRLIADAEGQSVLSSPYNSVRSAVKELVSETVFFVDELAEEYLPQSPYSSSSPSSNSVTSTDSHIGHLHELQWACVAGTAMMIMLLACAYSIMFSKRATRSGRAAGRRARHGRDKTLAHFGRRVEDSPRAGMKSKV